VENSNLALCRLGESRRGSGEYGCETEGISDAYLSFPGLVQHIRRSNARTVKGKVPTPFKKRPLYLATRKRRVLKGGKAVVTMLQPPCLGCWSAISTKPRSGR
jgi:hypothetical protein